MELDIGWEGRVHIHLAGVNHRVFWLTRRRERGTQKKMRRGLFDQGRWRRGGDECFFITL